MLLRLLLWLEGPLWQLLSILLLLLLLLPKGDGYVGGGEVLRSDGKQKALDRGLGWAERGIDSGTSVRPVAAVGSVLRARHTPWSRWRPMREFHEGIEGWLTSLVSSSEASELLTGHLQWIDGGVTRL